MPVHKYFFNVNSIKFKPNSQFFRIKLKSHNFIILQ